MRAHRLIGKDEKKYELCIGVRQGRNCVMLDKLKLKLHKTSFNELRFIFFVDETHSNHAQRLQRAVVEYNSRRL